MSSRSDGLSRGPKVSQWRILIDPPLPAAENMARDHALALLRRDSEGALRFYRWKPPALSLGRNEPLLPEYERLLARRPELQLVRRPTGGRAVIHDGELTYAVACGPRSLGGLRGAYALINRALVLGIRSLGVSAASGARPERRAKPPFAGACFAAPAPGEVQVDGRKLAGSAQARIAGAILQHGSVLLTTDQAELIALASDAEAQSRPHTLAELLPELPGWGRLVEALVQGFRCALGGEWRVSEWRDEERAAVAKLAKGYLESAWTRRGGSLVPRLPS